MKIYLIEMERIWLSSLLQLLISSELSWAGLNWVFRKETTIKCFTVVWWFSAGNFNGELKLSCKFFINIVVLGGPAFHQFYFTFNLITTQISITRHIMALREKAQYFLEKKMEKEFMKCFIVDQGDCSSIIYIITNTELKIKQRIGCHSGVQRKNHFCFNFELLDYWIG